MNYYDLLRVHPQASKKIIKDAYKALAKKYHPDLYESEKEKLWADEKMKAVNGAYETLMDDEKRLKYDKSIELPDKRGSNKVGSFVDKERVISLSIALIYILFSAISMGAYVIYVIAYMVLPIAAIWYSDEMGGYVGPFGRFNIDTETPGCFIKVIGWILLLGPLLGSIGSLIFG